MSNSLWPHKLQHTKFVSFIVSQSLLKLMSIESVMPSAISSSVVPLSSCLQSFPALGSFPRSQFFTLGGQIIWSFSFSISPSNEYSGLISFGIDWFDLFAVQGSFKSLLQHDSLKSMNFECLSLLPFKMAVEWRWFASFRGHDQESVINLLGTHLISINCIPKVANRQEATKSSALCVQNWKEEATL